MNASSLQEISLLIVLPQFLSLVWLYLGELHLDEELPCLLNSLFRQSEALARMGAERNNRNWTGEDHRRQRALRWACLRCRGVLLMNLGPAGLLIYWFGPQK